MTSAELAPPDPAGPPPARPVPFPLPPEATVVGGLFPRIEGPLKVMRALRRAGTSGDTVGFAIPLPGDPSDPATLEHLHRPPAKRFDPVRYFMVVLDPHKPPPSYHSLVAGQNATLTQYFLGDLASWVSGVKTFRIPAALAGADEHSADQAAAGGTWVLGRPNQSAAVAGWEGSDVGGILGALATIGVPADLAAAYAGRIAAGEVLLTTCETDAGRARRDQTWLMKNGATGVFTRVILSPRRANA